MAEIAAVPDSGLRVVSTFSGCGGSCLGFKMAGYRVLWASEFIPAAAEVYRANHTGTILDTRDIRRIQPAEILHATGLKAGEVDVTGRVAALRFIQYCGQAGEALGQGEALLRHGPAS
jgi:DNA (cytosine-5)-methyltransferase 1